MQPLDETRQAGQDSGQETEAPSAGDAGTTSQAAKTYTEDDVKKAVSDALAAAGRDAKAFEQQSQALKEQEQAIEARKAELARHEEELEAAEREAARFDPDKAKAFQAKQAEKQIRRTVEDERKQLAKERADLAKAKAEHEAEVEAARKVTHELKLREVAAKYDVPFKDINIPGLSIEQCTDVAKAIAAARGSAGKEGKSDFVRDSGVTSGATQKSEEQKLKERYPNMK